MIKTCRKLKRKKLPHTVPGTIFDHFKIEVPDLRVPADLFTFTKEILKENITFNPVPVSARLLCV